MRIESIEPPYERHSATVPVADAIAAIHATFEPGTHVEASLNVTLRSGRIVPFYFECFSEGYARRYPVAPLCARPDNRNTLLLQHVDIIVTGCSRSTEIEAAVSAIQIQKDIEDLMVRICAPDTCARIATGACSDLGDWHAPVEACATYNSDAASIVRDLALSWLHLYEGDEVERIAAMSVTELRARVKAAPPGASVAVARDMNAALKYIIAERALATSTGARHRMLDAQRRGSHVATERDAKLTREAVLRVFSTPPDALFSALEAAAVPDQDWYAVERHALRVIKAADEGALTRPADVTSRKHTQFIEQHAPFHVRRLPSGGVLLTTHPYRTLWPLWADALFVLGLM